MSKQTLGGATPPTCQFYMDVASGPDTGERRGGRGEGGERKETKSPVGFVMSLRGIWLVMMSGD